MINALELYRQIKDQLDTTSQPIKERASVLPLGQYEDGSVGLAWPGLLAAPAEGVANFGQYGYGEEAVPYNTRMAFDAAGGAMTGAGPAHIATAMTAKRFPVGGMADDAIKTVTTSKTATPWADALKSSILPEANRAGVFYRGVRDERGPINPDDPAWWASSSSRAANSYAAGDGSHVYPSRFKFSNPLEIDADGSWFENVPFEGSTMPTYKIARLARERGFDGVKFRNIADDPGSMDTADVVVALRPGTVYSATTGDLLYSNAPTGAALPVGMEASQQNQDPALLDYLRAVGLY